MKVSVQHHTHINKNTHRLRRLKHAINNSWAALCLVQDITRQRCWLTAAIHWTALCMPSWSAVLIKRITCVARPSVRPSVCRVRPHNSVTKRHKERKLMWTFSRAGVTVVPIFFSSNVWSSGPGRPHEYVGIEWHIMLLVLETITFYLLPNPCVINSFDAQISEKVVNGLLRNFWEMLVIPETNWFGILPASTAVSWLLQSRDFRLQKYPSTSLVGKE